jgi:integrase
MAKQKQWPSVRQRKENGRWIVDLGMVEKVLPDGTRTKTRKRIEKDTKEEAEEEARQQRELRRTVGMVGASLSADQVMDTVKALEKLQGRYSLEYAVDFLLSKRQASKLVTVEQVYESLCKEQEYRLYRDDMSDRHVRTTKSSLHEFVEKHRNVPISDIGKGDVQKWVRGLRLKSPVTEANRYRYLSVLFSHAVHEEWIETNPVVGIRKPSSRSGTPEFHTWQQVEKLLSYCHEHHPEALPRMAIGYFSGIRTAELDRFRWDFIKWDAGIIAMPADATKTRRPRAVTLQLCLAEWLLPYRKERGPLALNEFEFRTQRKKVCDAVEIKWVHNAQRHTFATHHYAFFRNAPLTAKELGHTGGIHLLEQNYAHTGITKAEATPFWEDVKPSMDAKFLAG